MRKLKNKKGLLKRVRISKNKKGLHGSRGRRHLLSGKSAKRKRQLRRKHELPAGMQRTLKHAVPYMK